MRYWLLAAVSSLSAFALCAAAASAVVSAASPRIARRLQAYGPASRVSLLFGLRVLPAALAMLFAFGIALPVFLWFEDAGTTEPVARTLAAIAAVGLALLSRGAARAWIAWTSTRAISARWRAAGRPLRELDTPVPAFAVEESYPIVAVAGVLHPALFISERVLAECSPAEVRAMVAHECAHLRGRDNARRFLMRACPDLMGRTPHLERAWHAAAEEAADAAAATSRPGSELELANALIRVARLAPSAAPALASAFYAGGGIDARVRRLIDPPSDREWRPWIGRAGLAALSVAFIGAVVLLAPSLHNAMERLVALLP